MNQKSSYWVTTSNNSFVKKKKGYDVQNDIPIIMDVAVAQKVPRRSQELTRGGVIY